MGRGLRPSCLAKVRIRITDLSFSLRLQYDSALSMTLSSFKHFDILLIVDFFTFGFFKIALKYYLCWLLMAFGLLFLFCFGHLKFCGLTQGKGVAIY